MKLFLTFITFFYITTATYAAEIKLQNPAINEEAPNFKAVNSYGKIIQLSDLKGTPVILEWTNHECPYVAKHYSENNMQNVQKRAQDEGFVWLSIISSTPGDQGHVDKATANALTKSRNAHPTHVLLDESGEIGMKYGAKTTPHMYMIDSSGVLKYKGAIDDVGRGMKFFSASLKDAVNYVATQLDDVKNILSDLNFREMEDEDWSRLIEKIERVTEKMEICDRVRRVCFMNLPHDITKFNTLRYSIHVYRLVVEVTSSQRYCLCVVIV